MGALQSIEDQLGGVFKGLPPLSANVRKSLAGVWPWLALVFGVLQLLAGLGVWNAIRAIDRVADITNSFSRAFTGQDAVTSGDKTMLYVGLAVLLVDAVILLMAFPELKKGAKKGWDLLFLGALLNVAYAVVSLFMDNYGVGNFLMSLVGSAVGFYLLFQTREYFK